MKKDTITNKELHALYKKRKSDQTKATTKRRRSLTTRPQDTGEILQSIFSKNGDALRKMEESKALLAWERYVGKGTVEHARAEKIRGGTLIVRVSDPLWMSELSMLKNSLLERFRKDFPSLRLTEIFFTR